MTNILDNLAPFITHSSKELFPYKPLLSLCLCRSLSLPLPLLTLSLSLCVYHSLLNIAREVIKMQFGFF